MYLIRGACIFFALTFTIVLSPCFPGHSWDSFCWREWALYIKREGLGNVYHSWTDYLPLLHYELWLFGKLAGSEKEIVESIGFLRIFTLIFDFVALWYLYKWLGRKIDYLFILFVCLLNIAWSYNSIVWGQHDGVLTAFAFLSLYYGFYNKPVLSGIFLVLALNFKLQAIVFVPIWALLYFNVLLTKPGLKQFILPLLVMLVLQLLILWPFAEAGVLDELLSVVTGSVDKFPMISMGAKNIWTFIFNGHTDEVCDGGIWFNGISYKQAGLFMFFTASFIALLPMIINSIRRIKYPALEKLVLKREHLWLASALVVMLFYFLNTQMHERYIHPAFIFIIAYAFNTGNLFAYVLFSIAYFLNLEKELQYLKLDNYETLFFSDIFIAALYFVVIVYLEIKLLRAYYAPGSIKEKPFYLSFNYKRLNA